MLNKTVLCHQQLQNLFEKKLNQFMCLRLKICLPQKQNYNKNHEIINAISIKPMLNQSTTEF